MRVITRCWIGCFAVASAVIVGMDGITVAADTSQLGFTAHRNNVAAASDAPSKWSDSKRVKWCQTIGTQTNASPVVAGDKVFIGTNNGAGHDRRYPPTVDLGVLLCLDKHSGSPLWQFSSQKLPTGKPHDWPEIGICSTPLVEGNWVWFVSNRGEVICLDSDGGRAQDPNDTEASLAVAGIGAPQVRWRLDMMQQLGVQQHNMANCSVTSAGEVLLVCTSNGIDRSHQQVAAPAAPSFLGIDKTSGELIWSDNSPGENILHGQWSSPSVADIAGTTQAIFAGGDGWLYSFDPRGDGHGNGRLLWKFDCNPKLSRWADDAELQRNNIIAMPVIAGDRVYVTMGQSPDRGVGEGRIWCIDAAKKLDGVDVSDELAVAADGRPLAPRRVQAVDRSQGETIRRNPNSAAVWCYTGDHGSHTGKADHHQTMHRSIGSVAVADQLVIAVDTSGVVHCLSAETGQPWWTHDLLGEVWASPLIVRDRVLVADTQGTISIFGMSADPQLAMRRVAGERQPLVQWELGDPIHSTPTISRGVLLVATQRMLYALDLAAD